MTRKQVLFNQPQLKFIVSICSGLFQVFTGTIILGFFFPGLMGDVSERHFIAGLIFAIICFALGFILSGRVRKES